MNMKMRRKGYLLFALLFCFISVAHFFLCQGRRTGNDPVPTEDTAGVYVVEKGDTLSKIARKLKLTLKQILSKNTIKNVNRIYPGQKIKY